MMVTIAPQEQMLLAASKRVTVPISSTTFMVIVIALNESLSKRMPHTERLRPLARPPMLPTMVIRWSSFSKSWLSWKAISLQFEATNIPNAQVASRCIVNKYPRLLMNCVKIGNLLSSISSWARESCTSLWATALEAISRVTCFFLGGTMKRLPMTPSTMTPPAKILRAKGTLFAISRENLLVSWSISSLLGLMRLTMTQLKRIVPNPKPDRHTPVQRPLRWGKCLYAFFMGGRYPNPMKIPLTIPMKATIPIKVSMKDAMKMLVPSPTTDTRHSSRFDKYLLATTSMGSPMASITMIREKTNEKAMEEVELPRQYRNEEMQGEMAAKVQREPSTMETSRAAASAPNSLPLKAILITRQAVIPRTLRYYRQEYQQINQETSKILIEHLHFSILHITETQKNASEKQMLSLKLYIQFSIQRI